MPFSDRCSTQACILSKSPPLQVTDAGLPTRVHQSSSIYSSTPAQRDQSLSTFYKPSPWPQGVGCHVCLPAPALPAAGVPLDGSQPGELQLPGHVPPHAHLQVHPLRDQRRGRPGHARHDGPPEPAARALISGGAAHCEHAGAGGKLLLRGRTTGATAAGRNQAARQHCRCCLQCQSEGRLGRHGLWMQSSALLHVQPTRACSVELQWHGMELMWAVFA